MDLFKRKARLYPVITFLVIGASLNFAAARIPAKNDTSFGRIVLDTSVLNAWSESERPSASCTISDSLQYSMYYYNAFTLQLLKGETELVINRLGTGQQWLFEHVRTDLKPVFINHGRQALFMQHGDSLVVFDLASQITQYIDSVRFFQAGDGWWAYKKSCLSASLFFEMSSTGPK